MSLALSPKNPEATDTAFTIEVSDDLTTWHSGAPYSDDADGYEHHLAGAGRGLGSAEVCAAASGALKRDVEP